MIYKTKYYLAERDQKAHLYVILPEGPFRTESEAFCSMYQTAAEQDEPGGLMQEKKPEYRDRTVITVKGKHALDYPRVYLEADRRAMLTRVDAAIARMETKLYLACEDHFTRLLREGIERLKEKREWVLDNKYTVRQVNEEACAAVGHMIADWTQRTQMTRSRVGAEKDYK